jgi:ribonuclease P protein component
VSKAVGNSVVRHAVTRRLRHVVRPRLTGLPSGSRLVVRALPAAATASSAELTSDLDAALERALRKAVRDAESSVGAL